LTALIIGVLFKDHWCPVVSTMMVLYHIGFKFADRVIVLRMQQNR
jgi:hypothetical protein